MHVYNFNCLKKLKSTLKNKEWRHKNVIFEVPLAKKSCDKHSPELMDTRNRVITLVLLHEYYPIREFLFNRQL